MYTASLQTSIPTSQLYGWDITAYYDDVEKF